MSNNNKEIVVAGIIGGAVAASLILAGALLFRRGGHFGGHKGRGGPWKEFPKLEKLNDSCMPQSIAPYSHGQAITFPNGSGIVYTAG